MKTIKIVIQIKWVQMYF